MSISIGSDLSGVAVNGLLNNTTTKTSDLENRLQSKPATDEELMEVCKSFESYLLEQVMKEMKKTVPNSDEQNQYLEYFGDMMYEEIAQDATEKEGLGIAQMLYESMKRNS